MTTITLSNRIDSSFKKQAVRLRTLFSLFSELIKLRITFFVAVTTFVGYILHNGSIDLNLILPTIGVLVLASGASAFNEYQERDSDKKMSRTADRPIPSGRISPVGALLISLILIFTGSILMFLHSTMVFLLGIFTLLWYNVIYTPLKRKTSMAIIPGSLVGALPPVIGWAASGGIIYDPKILSFALFMFIWQIPHFWLLMQMYDDEYKKAGYPTLSIIFSFEQISNITFAWIVILVLSSALLFISGLASSSLSLILIFLSGLITLSASFKITKAADKRIFKSSFITINLYVLFVLFVISIENLL